MSDDVTRAVRAVFRGGVFDYTFTPEQHVLIEALRDALRAEPSRSSPDPDLLAAAEHVVNVWAELRPDDMVQAVEDLAAALGSSPDLTGLDAEARDLIDILRITHKPGPGWRKRTPRCATCQTDDPCTVRRLLSNESFARLLPPTPETDPSQVER